jgi:hypothetical protein
MDSKLVALNIGLSRDTESLKNIFLKLLVFYDRTLKEMGLKNNNDNITYLSGYEVNLLEINLKWMA